MNRRFYVLFSLLALLLLAACSSGPETAPITQPPVTPPTTPPTQPGGNTISGTVTGPGDISNTQVVGCFSGDCGSAQSVVAVTDVSGNYTLANVTPGSYAVAAIKDVNNSGALDNGDYFGFYTLDNQNAATVTPPATGINITMQVYDDGTGGGTPPDTPPTTPPGGGSGISGTVSSASGDVANTAVLACPFTSSEPDCQSALSAVISQSGPSAAYSIDNTSTGQYAVIAVQDIEGDGNIDYIGFYSQDGQNFTPVTPPASSVDIQLVPYSGASVNVAGLGEVEMNALALDEFQGLLE